MEVLLLTFRGVGRRECSVDSGPAYQLKQQQKNGGKKFSEHMKFSYDRTHDSGLRSEILCVI